MSLTGSPRESSRRRRRHIEVRRQWLANTKPIGRELPMRLRWINTRRDPGRGSPHRPAGGPVVGHGAPEANEETA